MTRISMPLAILIGGLIGGALDLVFAVTFAGINGASPARVFQTIASGLLGKDAYQGGIAIEALGVACHFGISLLWAALFALAAARMPRLNARPWVTGSLYGIAVFLAMRLVVLPLSAYPRAVTFPPLATTLDLLSHMLLFGVPIALAVRRAAAVRGG